jgi:site-specific DNA-adenine methylase
MREENEFRKAYDKLRKDVINCIAVFVASDPEKKVMLSDDNGDLIINTIDDQESEVIQSIEVIETEGQPNQIVVWYGVYDEDNSMDIKDCSTEILLNILDAVVESMEL